MYFEFENKVNSLNYYSNSCGELHYNGDFSINENDLPNELKIAFDKLWSDDYGFNCYLTQFNNQYGIMLTAEYSTFDAKDFKIDYYIMLGKLQAFAKQLAYNLFNFDVIFCMDIEKYSEEDKESDIMVFIPYNIEKFELLKIVNYMIKEFRSFDIKH